MSISFPLARDGVAVLLVSHLGSDVFIMQNHLNWPVHMEKVLHVNNGFFMTRLVILLLIHEQLASELVIGVLGC